VNKSDSGPRKLTRGEPRDLIVDYLQRTGPKSVREVSEALDIHPSTVKRWMHGAKDCPNPIPLQKVGQHRYQLIGGTR
jgi:transposase